jgi:hypothetical protein
LQGKTELQLDATSPRAWTETSVAFLASVAFTMGLAWLAGETPWSPGAYARWDSANYLGIATAGSYIATCDTWGYSPDEWCGTAGWMPAYSLVLRVVSLSGIGIMQAALLVSHLFLFAALFLLRAMVAESQPGRERIALALAALFPGGIYLHAIFPTSALVLCALLCILFLSRLRFLAASLVVTVGAAVYSSGVLLSGLVGVSVLLLSEAPWRKRILKAVGFGTISFSGFGAVLLYHHLVTGRWNAFFLIQARNHFAGPLSRIYFELQQLFAGDLPRAMIAVQTLCMAAVCAGTVAYAVWSGKLTRLEKVTAGYVLLFWLFPLSTGNSLSLTRSEAGLVPLVILLAVLPRYPLMRILALFGILDVYITQLFFKSILI